MCCVKDAARATDQDQTDIAIARHHFDAALSLLATAHATDEDLVRAVTGLPC
jgi:hypothetical protein